MTAVWVAVALALTIGAGRGLVAMLGRHTSLYWFERWALSFLLGTGALSMVWFALSPLYGWIRPIWPLSAIALAGSVFGITRFRNTAQVSPRDWREGDRVAYVLGALLAIELAVVVFAALRLPLGWDGLFNFELKARLAFEHAPEGRLPFDYFSDASRRWSHPRYPLMVPFAEYWIYAWLGRVDQSAVKILFPLFYASLVALVCGAVRRTGGVRAALTAGIAVGLLPPLTVQLGATSGYADVPLAAAVAGAVSFAALAASRGAAEPFALAAALAAVAAWTKVEGVLLAGSLAVSVLVVAAWKRTIPLSRTAVLWWVPMLVAVLWLALQRRYGMSEADFLSVSPAVLLSNLHRVPTIAGLMIRELFRPGHWGTIWPVAAAAAAIMLAGRRVTARDALLAGAWGIPLVLYAAVFTFSAWPDLSEHMGFALPRLLVPLTPLALMFTMARLAGTQESGRS